ncbi:hypothetical protein C8R43DRAFT_1001768 [Mycena crocata]|nr:hypothetical protein C8R43DRAFT_1001768 [Mycena crocata]
MFFKVFCALSVLSLAVAAPAPQRPTGGAGQVFTVTRVFKTLTDVSPFIVDATTTMTFTYVLAVSSSLPILTMLLARALARSSRTQLALAGTHKCLFAF